MSISRRKVFYLSGFDPRGARYYHDLYRDESQKHAELTKQKIEVSQRHPGHDHEICWTVENKTAQTHTDYSFLCWDDIVRKQWVRNPITLTLKTLFTYISYAIYSDWKRAIPLSKAALITFSYPLITLLAMFLIFFGLLSMPPHLLELETYPWLWPAASALFSFVLSALLLTKIKSLWLLRFFIFNHKAFIQKPHYMEDRVEHFARLIRKCLKLEQYDEVIFLAHSNGSIMSIPVLEALYRHMPDGTPTQFKVVTLGQCVPLVSLHKNACSYRKDMKYVSSKSFMWVDLGAPADGAAYAMLSPFFPEKKVQTRIVLRSPQFHKYYKSPKYEKIKRNKFKYHFQYLCCGDKASPISIFEITAGAKKLEEIFSNETK